MTWHTRSLSILFLITALSGCSMPAQETASTPAVSQSAPEQTGTAALPSDATMNPAGPSGTSAPDSVPEPLLIAIPPPAGLKDGETVVASDQADLDGDGTVETVHIIQLDDGALWLRVGIYGKTTGVIRRQIADKDGNTDMFSGPAVSSLMLAQFSENPVRDIAIGFAEPQIGDNQWAIYRFTADEGLYPLRYEPFAIDTGIIALRDEDGDGRVERIQDTGHVIRIHRYVESSSGFILVHLRSIGMEIFDQKDPVDAARAWLYDLYNDIEPDLSSIMVDKTYKQPDIFTRYASWNEGYNGIAFTDGTLAAYQGLPAAECLLLTDSADRASVRMTDVSEFDESRRASVLVQLIKQADGNWLIDKVTQETALVLCLADDDNNKVKLTYIPVSLTSEETAAGYAPLLKELKKKTGLDIQNILLDGSAVLADLAPEMKLYLNQGSTGSALKVETLVRTLLSLPGARSVRFTIAGEADVEMDHYSFKGQFVLDESNLIVMESTAKQSPLAKTAEGTAEILFKALQEKDWETIARYAAPDKGTAVAKYGVVLPEDPLFTRMGWLSFIWDDSLQDFGYYDGSGFPVQETKTGYMESFFLSDVARKDWKFSVSTSAGTEGRHTGELSPWSVWPEAVKAEFFWPGTSKNEGMDWRSVTFVLEKTNGIWRLIGLVSNQWTI